VAKNGTIGFLTAVGGSLATQPDYSNAATNLNTIALGSAIVAVANINSAGTKLCGHKDWHLPNRNELRSLVNYEQSTAVSWLNNVGFVNVQATTYYSSTINTFNFYTWTINMASGAVEGIYPSYNLRHVLPVRGG
jgi:hypothetical protein